MKISQADYDRIMDPSKRDPVIEANRKKMLSRVDRIIEETRYRKAKVRAEKILDLFERFSVHVQLNRDEYLQKMIDIIADESDKHKSYFPKDVIEAIQSEASDDDPF